ncbi:hypothetical protein YTPLAS18_21240 [Nitrospira sp.]|nr:hypothetical protein YTPLAS18_21240 [Nitrospira sp.]
MPTHEALMNVLGGPSVLKKSTRSAGDITSHIREGMPFAALSAMATHAHLEIPRLAEILMIPKRTLARRRKARRLTADESDRLVRVARIFALAADVLGSEEKAAQWLQRTNRALGNAAPVDLLDTDVGTQSVEKVLGRIDYGVIG